MCRIDIRSDGPVSLLLHLVPEVQLKILFAAGRKHTKPLSAHRQVHLLAKDSREERLARVEPAGSSADFAFPGPVPPSA